VNDDGSTTLRVVTYNIHRSIGMDRRRRPARIAAVLAQVKADVIALQEVIGAGPNGGSHIEEIGAALGMGWVMASTRHLRGHQFGNAVLSHFPITHHVEHDLSWKTCESRGMQRADINVSGHTLHIYNVHLGTAILERRHQAQRIANIVADRHVSGPKLVLGDFNEWMRGLTTKLLSSKLKSVDLQSYLKRRRTGHGVGDGPDPPFTRPSIRERGPQPLSDHASCRARSHVEDVRIAGHATGGHQRVRPHAARV